MMIELENLKKKENVRETLRTLRERIKDAQEKQTLMQQIGEGELLISYLTHEDAKTRKNAALLLGDLGLQNALYALKDAYEAEETRFVRSAYLSAMAKLEAAEFLPYFKEQWEKLSAYTPALEEQKHVGEELHELSILITRIEGRKKHSFIGLKKPHRILLSTNREQREVTLKEVAEVSKTVRRTASLHPLGVMLYTEEVKPFTVLRTYRELLFWMAEGLSANPREAASQLFDAGLLTFLKECHKEEPPFAFRIELKNETPQTEYVKKLSVTLEQLANGALINDTKEYEVEIRLLATKEQGYVALLKLKTIPMRRFSYRKNAIAMSIHPATAAMMMQLAKPYLKERAQVLDPFCGVGTMLIERDLLVPARELYGIDLYGEAICGGRENASLAGEQINFIHRDFFDFKHDYLFDEIVSNMPVRGKKSKEEVDDFYARFFRKAATHLVSGGRLILYTNETGFVKKQLRLHEDYGLIQEFCIRKKEQFYLYVIEKR